MYFIKTLPDMESTEIQEHNRSLIKMKVVPWAQHQSVRKLPQSRECQVYKAK